MSKIKSQTLEDFIKESNKIHDLKYDYSKILKYAGRMKSRVEIICKIHGSFFQLANNHLLGQGCPICSYSKGELLIHN